MALNLFKKQKPEPQKEVEKIIERVEVEVYSRFTFAHDDNIEVRKYFFNREDTFTLGALQANQRFVYSGIKCDIGNVTLYPIFQMPSTLPVTRLVTPKKIICIGTIEVDTKTGEILRVTDQYVTGTLEEVMEMDINRDGSDSVQLATYAPTVTETVINDDEINLATFTRFIELQHDLANILD